jgi:Tol biopolymer transport system component
LYYFTGGGGRNGYLADLNQDATLATQPTLVMERFLNSNGIGTWSRDGESLAYFSFRGARESRGTTVLVIRTMKTGEEREIPIRLLVDYGLRSAPKWFPDGRSMLVVSRDEQSRAFRYSRVDVASGTAELLHSIRDSHSDPANSPEIAPDGQAIYFTEQESGLVSSARRLMRLDLASRQVTEVKRVEITSFALSPDGRQIGYLRYDGPTKATSLEVMPAAGGESRSLFRAAPWIDATRYAGVAWTPDGRTLLFVRRESETAGQPQVLWRIPAAGGTPAKIGIAGGSVSIRSQSIHPSGRRIAFAAGADIPKEVWVLENFLPPPTSSTSTRR